MEKKRIIIANPGSASRKYAFYENDKQVLFCHIEKEDNNFIATYKVLDNKKKIKISKNDYIKSANFFISLLIKEKLILKKRDIDVVGFRIVAPGDYFLKTREINLSYTKRLKKAKEEAPLHVIETFFEINEFSKLLTNAKFIGISDSAFHFNLPDITHTYAVSSDMLNKGVKRYGYHGISLSYIRKRIKVIFGLLPKRIIVCHLGSGASITALKNGESFDTSMGFTPLEGLIMSTRSGDIGIGAAIEIGRKKKLNSEKLEEYLNKKCGLLGVSNFSSDIRDLLKNEKNGDKKSKLALDMFVYRIKKYIGAYVAILGGVDVLVFTATIGERSSIIRERICEDLKYLNIEINTKKNNLILGEKEARIEKKLYNVKIIVIPTDETREMLEEILVFLNI